MSIPNATANQMQVIVNHPEYYFKIKCCTGSVVNTNLHVFVLPHSYAAIVKIVF